MAVTISTPEELLQVGTTNTLKVTVIFFLYSDYREMSTVSLMTTKQLKGVL